jgi:hypothetical protein
MLVTITKGVTMKISMDTMSGPFYDEKSYSAMKLLLMRVVVLACETDVSSISQPQFRSLCGIVRPTIMDMNGHCKDVLLSAIDEALDLAGDCCIAVRLRILNEKAIDESSHLLSQFLANKLELARLRSAVKRLSPVECFALIGRIEEVFDDHDGDFEDHFERVYKKVEASEYL